MSKLAIIDKRSHTQVTIESLIPGELFAFSPTSLPMMRTWCRLGEMEGAAYVALYGGEELETSGNTMVYPLTGTLTIK